MFSTVTPGTAVVTGSHIAAKDPATQEFQVCDPAKGANWRSIRPASRVPVNQKADLRLMLEAELDDGGKKDTRGRPKCSGRAWPTTSPSRDAVRLNPPVLTGLNPAPPFQVSGSIPVLAGGQGQGGSGGGRGEAAADDALVRRRRWRQGRRGLAR